MPPARRLTVGLKARKVRSCRMNVCRDLEFKLATVRVTLSGNDTRPRPHPRVIKDLEFQGRVCGEYVTYEETRVDRAQNPRQKILMPRPVVDHPVGSGCGLRRAANTYTEPRHVNTNLT